MSLFRKPGSPYWYADITVNGERRRFSTKRKTKKEAVAVEQSTIRDLLDKVQLGDKPEMTIQDAFGRFVRMHVGKSYISAVVSRIVRLTGLRYWTKAEGILKTPRKEPVSRWHLDPSKPMSSITDRTISRLWEARTGEGLLPGTINLELATLQKTYNLARKAWAVNVTPDVVFKRRKVAPKERYLSVQEEQRLLNELDPDNSRFASQNGRGDIQNQYDLVIFLLDTGARYGEVAQITWDAIDTVEWRYVNIYRWKVGNDGFLAMTRRLRDMLKRRYDKRGNSPYVFPHRDDPGRPRTYATRGIARAMQRAGLNRPHLVKRYGKATVHSLRDTFASRLAEAGYSIAKIQKLLGHANIQQTMKYAKFQERNAADEAAAILDRLSA